MDLGFCHFLAACLGTASYQSAAAAAAKAKERVD